MFALIEDQRVVAFPYTGRMLRDAYPATLFPPGAIPDEILMEYGVHRVHREEPQYNSMVEVVIQDSEPRLENGRWVVGHVVHRLPEVEAAANVRSRRNQLLADSDWTQAADSPADSAAWAIYRSALRDITSLPGFPWLAESDWPEAPA